MNRLRAVFFRLARLGAAALRRSQAVACLAAASFSGLAAAALGVAALAAATPALADPPPEVVRPAAPAKRGERAGETATTRRAGDLITYRFACHDAESMIALAQAGGANELAFIFQSNGKCDTYRSPVAAVLVQWVAGPYMAPNGRGKSSVWRIRDMMEETEFVWINDQGGRHAARREMAL